MAIAPCGVQRRRLWWGLGQRPNRSTGDQLCQTRSTKGAGSEASLPVTLRVRRRAPKLLFQPIQHCRARWARLTSIGNDSFLGAGLFRCRDFASAEATRGLCGRPLDCFAHTPMFLDFYCCRGNRAGGRDQRAFRSPFGNLRRRHFWGCLRLGSCCCKKIPRLRVQIRRTNPPPFKKPPRFARSGYCYPQRFHISCTYSTSMSSNASSPFFASAFASPWRTKHIVTKLRAEKIAA